MNRMNQILANLNLKKKSIFLTMKFQRLSLKFSDILLDFVPETNAACHAINKWLRESFSRIGAEAQRFLTMCHFEVDGVQINGVAQPFRFYLLARLQRIHEDADESEQNAILNLLKSCDMNSLLDMKLTRLLRCKKPRSLGLSVNETGMSPSRLCYLNAGRPLIYERLIDRSNRLLCLDLICRRRI